MFVSIGMVCTSLASQIDALELNKDRYETIKLQDLYLCSTSITTGLMC